MRNRLLAAPGDYLVTEAGDYLLIDFSPVVVYPVPSPTLESILRGSHTPVARVLFLDEGLSVTREVIGNVIQGSVTMDRGRDIHRSADVTLVNDDGTYSIVDSASLVWPNRLVRIERGAMVGGAAEYVTLITGIIDVPSDAQFSGAVKFTVNSRLQLALQPFPYPVTFDAGTRLSAVIRAIAELAGLGTADELYDLSSGGQALTDARTFDQQEVMLTTMVKLAFDVGADLYDTGAGVLTLRPFVDPSTVDPIWQFDAGGTLLSRSRSLRAQPGVYNRAIAIGSAPDRYPIRAEAVVTNPADPLYWSPAFDKPRAPYISPDVTTQQMANAVALRLLIEGAMGEDSVSGSTVPIPTIMRDGRPVVGYGSERHLLDQVVCPITKGAMTMTSKRVRSLVN